MIYQIVQQVNGKNFAPYLDQKTNQPLTFNSSAQAVQAAKELSAIKGVKFQPRPVATAANNWRLRENKRFAEGRYKPVCWVGQPWWDDNVNPDHFVHIAIKDPVRIAFTRSEADGLKDVQTSIRAGKYLTEYFSKLLTTEQIKLYAMQHSATFENKELKFATTPEEIERVYEPELGHSCFSGTKKANCYGSGDFAVAYIESADGEVKARVVCCPERKIYGYAYGDTYRIQRLLEDAGYECASSGASRWRGLRLLKEHYWEGFYTDFGGHFEPDPDNEKFMVLR